VASCAQSGDWVGEYTARRICGLACSKAFFDKAVDHLEGCEELAEEHADPDAVLQSLCDLGTICANGNLTFKAIAYDNRCLDRAVEEGNKLWEAIACYNLASGYYLQNYYDTAITHLERCLVLFRRVAAQDKVPCFNISRNVLIIE
jgi:hypothetical protein